MSSSWSSQVNLQVTWKIFQVKNPKTVFTLTATKVRISVSFPLMKSASLTHKGLDQQPAHDEDV